VRFKIEDEPEERFAAQAPPPVKVEIKDEPMENPFDAPIAANPLVSFAYGPTPRTFGISATAAAGDAARKQLTYARNGNTNSTMVSVAGSRVEFGGNAIGQWT